MQVSFQYDNTIVGRAARAGRCQLLMDYCSDNDRLRCLDPLAETGILCVPVRPQIGEPEFILFIGGTDRSNHFPELYTDVLDRFAEQASIALTHCRQLVSTPVRPSHTYVQNRVSAYALQSYNLRKILHAVLTGMTASYGLRFNRAALLLVDRNRLVGTIGIGHTDVSEARRAWGQPC